MTKKGIIITCPNCGHKEEFSLKEKYENWYQTDYENNNFSLYATYDITVVFKCRLCEYELEF